MHPGPDQQAVPAQFRRQLPADRPVHQGRRQGRDHRHGGGDPRAAEQFRDRRLLRLWQRLQQLRPARPPVFAGGRSAAAVYLAAVFGRRRPAGAPAGHDARGGHRRTPDEQPALGRHRAGFQVRASRPALGHHLLAHAVAMLSLRRPLLVLAFVAVVTAIVAPAALIGSALYTSAGLQFLIRHIPRQLGPVRLDIVGVRGTLADGLSVERVEIDHELVHLKFEGIAGRVALMPLRLQTLRVTHGSVRSALIQVKRRTRRSAPGPPVFMPRWLIISAKQAHVDSATLTVYNGFHLQASGIDSAAVLRHRVIRFFQADGMLGKEARVSGIGELRATDPLGMEVKGSVRWSPAGQPAWVVAGSARGDLNLLSIVAHIENPFRADVTGQLHDLTSQWHWAADAVVRDFDLRAWGVRSPLGGITAHLAASGDDAGFSAHGPVNPVGLRAGVFEAQFSGSYADRVLSARHVELRHPGSGAVLRGAGTIGIDGPRLDLSGEVSGLRWPLVGRDPALRSASGSFTLEGVLPYRVRASGSAQLAGLAAMPAQVSGTLGRDRATLGEYLVLQGGARRVGSHAPRARWAHQRAPGCALCRLRGGSEPAGARHPR